MPPKNTHQKIIEIPIRNTRFKIIGEQQENQLWNIHLIDTKNNRKELLKENKTTQSFATFSIIILKEEFPLEPP